MLFFREKAFTQAIKKPLRLEKIGYFLVGGGQIIDKYFFKEDFPLFKTKRMIVLKSSTKKNKEVKI